MEDETARDMCPICKTDRYLSPNMTFLINPECYHKICESCVDRIFSLGPAKCPYPKCFKTLRKNRFKKQIFDDIKIEKEVDIRKRVLAIYNSTEDDFKTLEEYNAYLESIEEKIFNLANEINAEEIEKEIAQYSAEHNIEILERATREAKKNDDYAKHQEALETLKQAKLKYVQEKEEEALEELKQQKLKLMEKLQYSNVNPDEVMKQHMSEQSKRQAQKEKDIRRMTKKLEEQILSSNSPAISKDPAPPAPFTPFCGDRDLNKGYKLLGKPAKDIVDITDSYNDPFVNKLAQNREYLGSGWRLKSIFEHALDEAFLGLHCYIDSEKSLIPSS